VLVALKADLRSGRFKIFDDYNKFSRALMAFDINLAGRPGISPPVMEGI
jgi:hypothetical protein